MRYVLSFGKKIYYLKTYDQDLHLFIPVRTRRQDEHRMVVAPFIQHKWCVADQFGRRGQPHYLPCNIILRFPVPTSGRDGIDGGNLSTASSARRAGCAGSGGSVGHYCILVGFVGDCLDQITAT